MKKGGSREMSYHWFKKMLLSTSILILSSSSLGLATHTVEAKDNLNGENQLLI